MTYVSVYDKWNCMLIKGEPSTVPRDLSLKCKYENPCNIIGLLTIFSTVAKPIISHDANRLCSTAKRRQVE